MWYLKITYVTILRLLRMHNDCYTIDKNFIVLMYYLNYLTRIFLLCSNRLWSISPVLFFKLCVKSFLLPLWKTNQYLNSIQKDWSYFSSFFAKAMFILPKNITRPLPPGVYGRMEKSQYIGLFWTARFQNKKIVTWQYHLQIRIPLNIP